MTRTYAPRGGVTRDKPRWALRYSTTKETTREISAPLITKKGLQFAQFAGPGTHILSKLHTRPVSGVDRAAKIHDLRYAMAKNSDDVSAADREYIKNVASSGDNLYNKFVTAVPVMFKMGVNHVIPSTADWFTGGNNYTEWDLKRLNNSLQSTLLSKE